jgi:hypothetical protein
MTTTWKTDCNDESSICGPLRLVRFRSEASTADAGCVPQARGARKSEWRLNGFCSSHDGYGVGHRDGFRIDHGDTLA